MIKQSFLLWMLVLMSFVSLGETTSLIQDQFNCPSDSSKVFIQSLDKCRSENPNIDYIVVCAKNDMKDSYPNYIWSVFAIKQLTDLHFSAQIPCLKFDTRDVYGILLTGYPLCEKDDTWKIIGIIAASLAGILIIAIVIFIIRKKCKENNPFLGQQRLLNKQ